MSPYGCQTFGLKLMRPLVSGVFLKMVGNTASLIVAWVNLDTSISSITKHKSFLVVNRRCI